MTTNRKTMAVLAAGAVLFTCSNLDNIDVSADGQAVIPQRSIIDEVIGQLSFVGFDGFDISQDQEFENAGYTKDQIDSVRLKTFELTIVDPVGANFDFVSGIRFFAESDGLERVEIASLDPVPAGSTVLDLDLADVELRDYAAAETMTIVTEATGTRPPEQTTIAAEVVLDVDVAITGACN